MLRFLRLWQERISSSSSSVSTLACLRYGIKMHGRTPKEILWRLSLISSHSSSSPICFRSGPSGTHSPAICGVFLITCRLQRCELAPSPATSLVPGTRKSGANKLEEVEKAWQDLPRPVGVCFKVCVCVYLVWVNWKTCKTSPVWKSTKWD